MSKQKFQKGDKVRIATKYQNKYNCITTEGVVLEVSTFGSRYKYLVHFDDKKFKSYYFSYELEKVVDKPKFKVGDKVRFSEKAKKWFDQNSITYDPQDIYTISKEKNGVYYLEYVSDYLFDGDDLILVNNENKQDMDNERTVKLTLKKAKEWYKAGGELKEVALQVYTEQELSDLPRSWEEFCKNTPIDSSKERTIGASGKPITPIDLSQFRTNGTCRRTGRPEEISFSVLPSEKYVNAFVALMKLMSLRQAWIGDWKPDWNDVKSIKWCINQIRYEFKVYSFAETHKVLSFPTQEMAQDFFDTFKNLILQAKILL